LFEEKREKKEELIYAYMQIVNYILFNIKGVTCFFSLAFLYYSINWNLCNI